MPTLQQDLDALAQAVIARATALIGNADDRGVALVAKAIEALKGTASLYAILEAGDAAQADIAANLATAIASLASNAAGSVSAVNAERVDSLAALQTAYDTNLAAHLAVLLNNGALRIGDIQMMIVPNTANLASNLALCNGGTLPVADCPALITAWGVGGTLSPFVTQYNSTAGGSTGRAVIAVEGGTVLRLPKFDDLFPRVRAAADMGKCVVGTNQTAQAVNTGSAANVVLRADAENRPNNFGMVAVVRYR